MPLYEYLCRDCEKEVELLVRSNNESLECPFCDGSRLMKLLSVPSAPSSSSEQRFGSAAGSSGPPPAGGCGSGCGCFPQG